MLRFLVPLLFLVFWVIGQINQGKKAKPQARRQRQPNAPRDPNAGQRPDRPQDQAQSLRDQMEEFVRQAQRERGAEPAAPVRTLVKPRRNEPEIELLAIGDEPDDAVASVAGGPRRLTERDAHLGEQVALADDKLESHIHAKFDHDLGRLADTHVEDAYELKSRENTAAKDIAERLANPQGVIQAVLLNEILTRPADRW